LCVHPATNSSQQHQLVQYDALKVDVSRDELQRERVTGRRAQCTEQIVHRPEDGVGAEAQSLHHVAAGLRSISTSGPVELLMLAQDSDDELTQLTLCWRPE
jgi:hypothetical protein